MQHGPTLFSQHDPSQKRTPLRARRRRAHLSLFLLLLAALTISAVGIHWLSYQPQLSIEQITIEGTRMVPPELIRSYVESQLDRAGSSFISPRNIFLYSKGAIEKHLAQEFARVRSAKLSRPSLMSRTLVVSIEEHEAFAKWCASADRCYLMDDTGYILDTADASSTESVSTQYVFSGGIGDATGSLASTSVEIPIGRTFVSAHVPGILSLLQLLGQSGFSPQGANVVSDEDFVVPLSDGFILKASFGANANTLVKNLQLVLSSDDLKGKEDQLEYIDLRFGNRVYYKLKGQGQTTSTTH